MEWQLSTAQAAGYLGSTLFGSNVWAKQKKEERKDWSVAVVHHNPKGAHIHHIGAGGSMIHLHPWPPG